MLRNLIEYLSNSKISPLPKFCLLENYRKFGDFSLCWIGYILLINKTVSTDITKDTGL